jgi:hypothetical protein
MFSRRIFQQQFEHAYEMSSPVGNSRETKFPLASRETAFPLAEAPSRETAFPLEDIIKNIAIKETKSSLYDLGEMVYEKQMQSYTTADNISVLFRVKELYGAKVLHAKTPETDDWTFITKFDCN